MLSSRTEFSVCVGRVIRHDRRAKGYTQEQVAEAVSMGQGGYSRYETGRTAIAVDVLAELATTLDAQPGHILERAGVLREAAKGHFEKPKDLAMWCDGLLAEWAQDREADDE